ncbi:MAG: DUF2207 domain-containing protein [Candidatus Cloacimonetes bacterium]|nr:DUF2207 domain-containing protein [Candidatus Cloacimonadota bacterium]
MISKLSFNILLILLTNLFSLLLYGEDSRITVTSTIEADLTPAGSLSIVEKMYIHAGHNLKSFQYWLPVDQTYEYSDFTFSIENSEQSRNPQPEVDSLMLFEEADRRYFTLFFPEEKQNWYLILSYRIMNTVSVYLDGAVFYFPFLSPSAACYYREIDISLIPEQAVRPGSMEYWVHGPAGTVTSADSTGIIRIRSQDISDPEKFAVRIIYPVTCFPELPRQQFKVREHLRIKEAEWTRTSLIEQNVIPPEKEGITSAQTGFIILIFSSLLLLLGVIIYLRSSLAGRKTGTENDKVKDPTEYSPALVAHLFAPHHFRGNALISSLLNQAARGNIQICSPGNSENSNGLCLCLKKELSSLHPEVAEDIFELELVHFLFGEMMGSHQKLYFEQIQANRIRLLEFIKKWGQKIIAWNFRIGWFDKKISRLINQYRKLSLLLFLLSIPVFFLYKLWGLPPMITAGLFFLLGCGMNPRTPLGKSLFLRWKFFREGLGKVSGKLPTQGVIEKTLIYGIALNLESDWMQKLIDQYPEKELKNIINWFYILLDEIDNDYGGCYTSAFNGMLLQVFSTFNIKAGRKKTELR